VNSIPNVAATGHTVQSAMALAADGIQEKFAEFAADPELEAV